MVDDMQQGYFHHIFMSTPGGATDGPDADPAGSLVACVLAAACRGPDAGEPPFVWKIWMSTDPSAPAGTLRIFLPDGTLVRDSCGETYRLARWRAVRERRIEWQEDTARIAAEVTQVSADWLQLRLHLVGENKDENYRSAPVPFVCADARP